MTSLWRGIINALIATALGVGLGYACTESLKAQQQQRTTPTPQVRMPPQLITGIAQVIDGDTIRIDNQRIRLFGIDALEPNQTCAAWPGGAQATLFLRTLIEGQVLFCEVKEYDKARRPAAICTRIEGGDVGGEMVLQGFALADSYVSTRYIGHERAARTAGINIHQQGRRCRPPWAWRKANPNEGEN